MATIKRGVIKSYSSGTHKASVQITGSLAVWLDALPVATDIPAAEVIPGRECSVLLYTDDNPDDGVIITVHGGVPATPAVGLQQQIRDTDADTIVHTETAPDQDQVRVTTAATLRAIIGNASPHHDLFGHMRVSQNIQAGGNPLLSILEEARISTRDDGTPDGVVGVLADIGSLTTLGTGVIKGVTGRALARNLLTIDVFGLDYLAGMQARSLTNATAARLQLLMFSGTGFTVVASHGVDVRSPINLGATLTTVYGVRVQPQTTGDNRRPFQEEGTSVSADAHGNRFLSNTQFASLIGAFGGGAGVIGIANRVTVPSTNPAGGGVLYAEAGSLRWRGSAGTITIIAPA
jgi:hypothetical protein